MPNTFYNNWQEQVTFAADGPHPKLLEQNEHFRVVLAGLEPGQKIPVHPEAASVFQILDGQGWLTAGDQRLPVQAGSTVILEDGAERGVEAGTRLVFLAVRMETPGK